MNRILLTGGGSAGHVTPNLALLPALREAGFEVEYIGGAGIEAELTAKAGIPFNTISTGKLRRDKLLSVKNMKDALGAIKGVSDAGKVIKRFKPHVIFSKGGFVGLPVAVAGKLHGINLILHESDITPGLANRLSAVFAGTICASFPETMEALPRKKAVLTGNPVRRELFSGDWEEGRRICGFTGGKPIILVTGGSLGAQSLNEILRAALPFLKDFDIVHLCGKGKVDTSAASAGYVQFEYLNEEMRHVLSAADIVVSRAGSNTINELLALKKPSLLIPLANKATRGDQPHNAESFKKRGFAMVEQEAGLTPKSLSAAITNLYQNRAGYISNMEKSPQADAVGKIIAVIVKNVSGKPGRD